MLKVLSKTVNKQGDLRYAVEVKGVRLVTPNIFSEKILQGKSFNIKRGATIVLNEKDEGDLKSIIVDTISRAKTPAVIEDLEKLKISRLTWQELVKVRDSSTGASLISSVYKPIYKDDVDAGYMFQTFSPNFKGNEGTSYGVFMGDRREKYGKRNLEDYNKLVSKSKQVPVPQDGDTADVLLTISPKKLKASVYINLEELILRERGEPYYSAGHISEEYNKLEDVVLPDIEELDSAMEDIDVSDIEIEEIK